MLAYVVCKLGLYHPTKPVIVPKLYVYMSNFEVKAGAGNDPWCVVIVEDSTQIPAGATTDSDIYIFSTAAELDTALSTPQRNAVNTQLALTGWAIDSVPVTAVSGNTPRIVLDKIRQAMGQSVESWGLGL